MSGTAPTGPGDRPARGRRRHPVVLAFRQLRYEQLAFWRNPWGAVFTIGFSLVFLVLESASGAGSALGAGYAGVHAIQYFVGGFAAYGVMAACFNTLAMQVVARRETGLLKRLRLSPLPTGSMFGALVGSALIVSVLDVALVMAVGALGYHARLPTDPVPLLVAVVVGVAAFTSLGVAASTVVPNQEAAGPMIGIVFFVLLFLSGLWAPLRPGSTLARISDWFPIRHLLLAMFQPFDTQRGASPWDWGDLRWVALWGVVGAVAAVRRFRWEPRRA